MYLYKYTCNNICATLNICMSECILQNVSLFEFTRPELPTNKRQTLQLEKNHFIHPGFLHQVFGSLGIHVNIFLYFALFVPPHYFYENLANVTSSSCCQRVASF